MKIFVLFREHQQALLSLGGVLPGEHVHVRVRRLHLFILHI
jgi:hypothetical protein